MPANITCTASESHWSNTETMMEMFQAIAASVDSGPDAPIVVVLDCAPIHTSKEFRRRVREEMPVESFLDQGGDSSLLEASS